MISFPHAKINLGLNVTAKRDDGFHEIETVIFPIQLSDALEITVNPDTEFSFNPSGIIIDDNNDNNLCSRAYRLIKEKYNLPPVQIYLLKHIPIGAGLGGGSSDAAFTLKMLRDIFRLDIPQSQMHEMAATLGSDCPFFLYDRAMLATGRGEILKPLKGPDLTGFHLLLITPPIHVSTALAYMELIPQPAATPLSLIIQQPVDQWKDNLVNDFEKNIFRKYPAISQIKDKLYEAGAVYASMSGSGSSVFGLFENEHQLPKDSGFENCFVWKQKL